MRGTGHYWIESLSKWECKECKHRTSIKAGTVMEHSNLDYRMWLWALYLMAMTKKGYSALEMQRILGHKRYEPVWLLMHKIRVSMGNRDARYRLDGFVEMDEGFFEGHRKKWRGRGRKKRPAKEIDRQVKVIVAVSTQKIPPKEREKHKPNTAPRYLKMEVVEKLSRKAVMRIGNKIVDTAATVHTDGRWCYRALESKVNHHVAEVIKDKSKISKAFPWVHTAISNAKKKILGLHHQVKDEYMQNYLNEFCYKFNRRFFGQQLFDRLMVAALERPWNSNLPNYG